MRIKKGGYLLLMIFIISNKLQHLQCMESFFRLEFEEKAVDKSINTTFIEKTQSELDCYMSCLNKNGKCCLMGIKEEQNQFVCFMYGITTSKATYYSEKNSKIVSVVDCPPPPDKDCKILRGEGNTKDGVYEVSIKGRTTNVFCDMTTDGGGWTVFQKRFDGSVDFARTWEEYRNGFGDVAGEHWLGNELISHLTKGRSEVLLRIESKSAGGLVKHITMKGFWVDDEASKYILHTGVRLDDIAGMVNDWLDLDGMKFSTQNHDNDVDDDRHCSMEMLVGGFEIVIVSIYTDCMWFIKPTVKV